MNNCFPPETDKDAHRLVVLLFWKPPPLQNIALQQRGERFCDRVWEGGLTLGRGEAANLVQEVPSPMQLLSKAGVFEREHMGSIWIILKGDLFNGFPSHTPCTALALEP